MMRHRNLKYGLVVALLVAAGAVYFQPGKCTTIRFEQDTLRLGQVALGATVPFVFKYTNTGDVPLLIKNVQTTCGCTAAEV